MSTTRAAEKNGDAPVAEPAAGVKHDVDDKPVSEAKRTKTEGDGKQQTTIEDTMPGYVHHAPSLIPTTMA
jgi:hypothetical protein